VSRRSVLPVLCAAALVLAPAHPSVARVGVVVGFAPPAPVVEVVPPPPAPGYVWQPGYWSWNGVQYVWVPGAYVVAPFVHAVWVARSLGQARPRLGLESWPLAAVKLAAFFEGWNLGGTKLCGCGPRGSADLALRIAARLAMK
jgi:WXXGXW repeat (2 copies)